VVSPAYASVDPRAVVVKSLDAGATNIAMPAPRYFNDLAFRAEINRVYLI
jgi:hypothetical protein